jgi:hypothetical protein
MVEKPISGSEYRLVVHEGADCYWYQNDYLGKRTKT